MNAQTQSALPLHCPLCGESGVPIPSKDYCPHQSALDRAIEYLGAVEVAPGRYAYLTDTLARLSHKDHVNRWAITTSGALIKYEILREDGEFVYTASGELMASSNIMPAWWTPENRFAYVNAEGDRTHCSDDLNDQAEALAESLGLQHEEFFDPYLITANLETGEEEVAS